MIEIGPGTMVSVGAMVRAHAYDGLGRLIRNQWPFGQTNKLRTAHYYYDGVRRIQEVVTDPITSIGGIGGDPGLQGIAGQTLDPNADPDPESAPLGFEEGQVEAGGLWRGVSREYVSGPGDGEFDELLVQYDGYGGALYAILDAGGDLVALCDLGGASDSARVVGQWTYDAYGEVIAADVIHAHESVRLGHKGLFVDRLDDPALNISALEPFADIIFYNRNRTLHPGPGRFLQKDPNATGQVNARDLPRFGSSVSSPVIDVSIQSHLNDGFNTLGYLAGNPIGHSDPAGLSLGTLVGMAVGLIVPGPSDWITGALQALVEDYGARLDWDVEWAMDWDMGDDWHSRLDSSWIKVSMARGVYESFEIPFTGINPLDYVHAGTYPKGYDLGPLSGLVHHIMTDKNSKAGLRWTEKYKTLFERHGLDRSAVFRWEENLVRLPDHRGPHTDAYHSAIYNRVEAALESVPDRSDLTAVEKALRAQLREIKVDLIKTRGRAFGLRRPGRKG